MATSSRPTATRLPDDDASRLLVQRVRTSLLLVAIATAAFAVADLRFTPEQVQWLWAFKLVQIVNLAISLPLLARAPTPHRAMMIAAITFVLVAYLSALSGIVIRDLVASPLLIIFSTVLAAIIVPWGARAQILATIVAGSAVFINVATVAGTDAVLQPPSVVVVAALFVSIYLASEFARQRVVLAERDQARQQAAAAQQRLVEILEATSDLVGTADTQGRVLYYNAAGRRLLGLGPDDDLSEMKVSEHVPPWARRVVAGAALRAARGGRTWSGETAVLSLDGTEIPVSQVIVPHFSPDGELVALSTIARDISEQKRIEAALHGEVRVSGALARVGRELISALDRPDLVPFLCRMVTEVVGCDTSHILLAQPERQSYAVVGGYGDPEEYWESIRLLEIPNDRMQNLLDRIERDESVQTIMSTDGKAPLGPDEMAPTVDGDVEPSPLLLLARNYGYSRILNVALRRGGEMIGVLTASYRGRSAAFSEDQTRVARGIAHLAALVLEHTQLVDALERANQLKSEFVATMSHELRTPLNVILGYASLMREEAFGPVTGVQGDTLVRLEENAHELLGLIDATLDLSRLDSGRVTVDARPLSIGDLIVELQSETRHIDRTPDCRVHWDVPAALPPIQTDPLKLKVILKNLLVNAGKFTEKGTITLRVRSDDEAVHFAVADTGIGIAPDSLPVIFEAFRQVDSSSTRRHGGVGLGLHIVRRLADLLGATVSVESELGRGSTFTVALPRHPARAAAEIEAYGRVRRAVG